MISICIPSFNRTQLVIDSFIQVLHDKRISEVVIIDDASDSKEFFKLSDLIDHIQYPDKWKIKLYRNENNIDCYRNKRESVSKANKEWVVLLDSDNVIDKSYLDAISSLPSWDEDYIYQPSFARPHFDFRKFQGLKINKYNVNQWMEDATFETMMNACNYFVNRDAYLKVWDGSVDPVTSDSIYFAYKWLESGNTIYVRPDMEYDHRVHDGSHYRNNVRRTPRGFHEDIVQRLKNMR